MSEEQLTVEGYELLSVIASGNTSQVWEAGTPGGGDHVAIKLLLPEARKDSEQVRVLKHEAKVMKTLDHPAFVRLHKVGVTKQTAFVVMDYFRAPNLKTQIGGDFTGLQTRMAKLVESLCLALDYMHDKGWLHRDIKPENVLFNKAGEMRLIDFSLSSRNAGGLAKLLGGKQKSIQGTRTYIAPETLLRKPATPQTDMYSLGITLFELLTGQPPFTGTSPKDLLIRHVEAKPPAPSMLNPNVTAEMDRFVLRMLAKKPAARFKSMKELYAEFRAVKIYKEEPAELAERQERERKARAMDDLNTAARLDSRADHQRSALQEERGEKPKPAPKPAAKRVPKPQPAAQAPARPQPMPPPMPYPPGMPQPPVPTGPMAGPGHMTPYPGPPQQFPQHFPPPGMPPYGPPGGPMPYPPGYPPPQPGQPPQFQGQRPPMPAGPPQPQPPPQAMPPAGRPPQPAPQPAAGPPRTPQPTPPPAAVPQRPPQGQPAAPPPSPAVLDDKRTEKRHASQKPGDEELPAMEELPDIL